MGQNKKYSPEKGRQFTEYNFAVESAMGGAGGFQGGSTMKPYTTMAWLESGHTMYETINAPRDKNYPASFRWKASCLPGGYTTVGGGWTPGNAVDGWASSGTVDYGLFNSVNSFTVSEASQLDLCDIAEATERLGLLDYDQYYDWKKGEESTKAQPINPAYPSFVIGSARITPLAQATAFATWANNGEYCENRALTSVTDSSGNKYKVKPVKCEQVMSPQVVADMNGTLKKIASQKVAKGRDQLPDCRQDRYQQRCQLHLVRGLHHRHVLRRLGWTLGQGPEAEDPGRSDQWRCAVAGSTRAPGPHRCGPTTCWTSDACTRPNSLGRATPAPAPKPEPKRAKSNSNDDSSNGDSSNDDSKRTRQTDNSLQRGNVVESIERPSPTAIPRTGTRRQGTSRQSRRRAMTNHMANTHRLASAVSRTVRGAALAVGAAAAGAGVLIGYGMSEATRFGVREETLPLLAPGRRADQDPAPLGHPHGAEPGTQAPLAPLAGRLESGPGHQHGRQPGPLRGPGFPA